MDITVRCMDITVHTHSYMLLIIIQAKYLFHNYKIY